MKCFVWPLLHVNLFPLTTKPLNVFEPQYLKMIYDSIETKTPIALAYRPENGDTYRTVAGYGHPQIIDSRPNNTLLVFLAGHGKARLPIVNPTNDSEYIVTEVLPIDEDLVLDDLLKSKYMKLSQLLVQWVQRHIPEPQQRDIFIKSLSGPQEIIGAFAAYLIKDYDLQYEMMEIFSLNDQINYLYRLFESNELTT